jgi:hypothetical protein
VYHHYLAYSNSSLVDCRVIILSVTMATEVIYSSDDELGVGIPTAIRRDEELEVAIEAAKRREYSVDSNVMLDKRYYLEMDVCIEAIQDEGEIDPKSGDRQLIHHPKIKSLANKIFNKLKTNKFPDIPANITRVSPFIVEIINFKIKKVGVSSVQDGLQKYSADGKELYIVHNNLLFYGYNIILSEIHFFLWKSKKKKSEERYPADAKIGSHYAPSRSSKVCSHDVIRIKSSQSTIRPSCRLQLCLGNGCSSTVQRINE